ncbi:PAS domain-containing protein [Rasiella sp. SM2506]|uniref:PAS domain-containing protein n=1 Tax=Rasiella sp. SM2506 TaxID=3423914 RepID=UPI003D7B9F0C
MNFLAQKRKKILLQENSPTPNKNNPFDDFYYKEIALLTGAGGYWVDFITKTSFIDPQGKRILEIADLNFSPSLTDILNFHAPEERERTIATFKACAKGQPFKTQVKMLTATGDVFWASAIGKPMYDVDENIVGVQGVFQDITQAKYRELKLQESMKTITTQNSRLFSYANLASHNLKSHASNISMSLELLGDTKDTNEAKELYNVLKEITNELCKTVNNLSEIVSIKDTAKLAKKNIDFEDVTVLVQQRIEATLSKHKVQVYTDFSEAPTVHYIRTYLESILETLFLRAIEHKHPDRTPSINIFSLDNDGNTTLLIRDNGIGFSTQEDMQKVFDLKSYKSAGCQSQNVNLFQLKNKVTALGGTISAESTLERGTTFTIIF